MQQLNTKKTASVSRMVIPHCYLHVEDSVRLQQSAIKSKYNPAHIVVAIHTIRKLVEEGVWKQSEINISIAPYREQARQYRIALKKAGLSDVKVDLWDLEVFTVDIMQGKENECIFFDSVIARERVNDKARSGSSGA